MRFNWRTEGEQDWDREDHASSSDPERSRGRRWPHLALFFLLLTVSGLVLWRSVQGRIERNREALEQDVRASHRLVARAIESRDAELLTAVLSGRDPAWTETQRRLLQRGLLAAGAVQPFGLVADDTALSLDHVQWSPDLREAQVTSSYTVTVAGGRRAAAPIRLRQTTLYRRGADRWLLAPPTGEFWGPWQSQSAAHITLAFRRRDAQVAAQMLPILDGALAALCDALSHPCPPENGFHVRLDPDGEALRRLQNDRLPTFRFGELSLPSPSLVGQTPDERAAETLHRGYAHYLLVAATQELLDFDCCQGAQFMDALAATVAYELGYGPAPLQDGDYLPMVDVLQSLGQFNRLWWGAYRIPFTAADRAQVAAFNAFLREQSGASTVELQQALAGAFGFWDWIQPFARYDVVAQRAALEAAWRDFVLAQANAAQPSLATTPPPEQLLNLICEDNAGSAPSTVLIPCIRVGLTNGRSPVAPRRWRRRRATMVWSFSTVSRPIRDACPHVYDSTDGKFLCPAIWRLPTACPQIPRANLCPCGAFLKVVEPSMVPCCLTLRSVAANVVAGSVSFPAFPRGPLLASRC